MDTDSTFEIEDRMTWYLFFRLPGLPLNANSLLLMRLLQQLQQNYTTSVWCCLIIGYFFGIYQYWLCTYFGMPSCITIIQEWLLRCINHHRWAEYTLQHVKGNQEKKEIHAGTCVCIARICAYTCRIQWNLLKPNKIVKQNNVQELCSGRRFSKHQRMPPTTRYIRWVVSFDRDLGRYVSVYCIPQAKLHM